MSSIDWAQGAIVGIPATVALATVALLGYMFGCRTRSAGGSNLGSVGPRELHRAARIACQLEDTIDGLRKQLAEHRNHVVRFKTKVAGASEFDPNEALAILSTEAEQVILPTLRLASQLSLAYDELRQQSQSLSNFTEGRTDPLTGLGNTPALEEQLELALADCRAGVPASVAIVSVEAPAGIHPGDNAHREFVKRVADEIEQCVRDYDYVARLGGAEFAVLMPKTTLAGARIFGARQRSRFEQHLSLAGSVGITELATSDSTQAALSRADSALYSARATGGSAQYVHTGSFIQADSGLPAKPSPAVAEKQGSELLVEAQLKVLDIEQALADSPCEEEPQTANLA